MNIPLNIILDNLGEYNLVNYVEEPDSRSFGLVNLFPTRERELPPEHLYVGKLSEVLTAEWRTQEICCIALRDRMQDDEETPERMKNLIVLNCNADLFDLFTGLQRVFFRIFNWINTMNEYIIQNRTIQDMLVLSEPILGNFITISDSTLSLVAYTPDIECDCPVSRFLVEHGYHSEETISLFQSNNMPEHWATATDIYVNDSHVASPYTYASKVVRYNNAYFSHVIMICNNNPPTKGVLELFRMLIDHLMVFFERLWRGNSGPTHTYDGIIRNLIEDRDLSPEIIQTRAQYAGLPSKARFRLFTVRPEGSTDTLMQRFGRDVLDHVPESKVTLYNHGFIILLADAPGRQDHVQSVREYLEQMLERYNAHCGMSDEFDSLLDLKIAYEQTEIALQYGSLKTMLPFSSSALRGSLRLHSYESYYPCHLLCSSPENVRMAQRTRAYRALKTLQEYDDQHATNNLALLYFYLTNDRRATETAARLHMHRNNVIYRISRIEEMIDMELSDSSVRFRLLLAYEMFSLGK